MQAPHGVAFAPRRRRRRGEQTDAFKVKLKFGRNISVEGSGGEDCFVLKFVLMFSMLLHVCAQETKCNKTVQPYEGLTQQRNQHRNSVSGVLRRLRHQSAASVSPPATNCCSAQHSRAFVCFGCGAMAHQTSRARLARGDCDCSYTVTRSGSFISTPTAP